MDNHGPHVEKHYSRVLPRKSCSQMNMFAVNEMVASSMKRLGKCIARNPILFILAAITLSAGLLPGILYAKYENDLLNIMEVQDSKFKESRILLSSLFPLNTSRDFDPARLFALPRGAMVHILNKSGKTMLNESVFKDIQLIHDIVLNISVTATGMTLKYSDICAKKANSCYFNPIIKLLPEIKAIIAGKYRFKYPLDVSKVHYIPILYGVNLGGITIDEDKYVESVMAIRLLYFLDSSDLEKKKYIDDWEISVAEELSKRQFRSVDVYITILNEMQEAAEDVAKSLYPMIGVVTSVMILFSIFTFMTNNWIRSKPWLGIAAGMSAGLAIAASYGFASLIGIPFNFFNAVIPFLVLGTEIDDAFVLVASWRMTNPEDNIESKMGEAFSRAAVSITLTSLTSFIAYCIGINVPIAFIRTACAHMATCIFFTYLYQLVFFGSCMALDGRREEQGRNSITFLRKKRDEERNENQEEVLTNWIQIYFGGFVALPFVKFACLIIFILNMAVGVYGIFYLKIGVDLSQIMLPGSRIDKSLEIGYKYFSSYNVVMHIIINKPLNYADKAVQESIEEMLKMFENHPHISDNSYLISWLKFYKIFAESPVGKFSLQGYNISEKQDFIDGLRNSFLKIQSTRQFEQDINFNEDFTEITSSRFIMPLEDITNFEIEKSVTKDVSAIMENSRIPIGVYSLVFNRAEEGVVIMSITTKCIWLTTLIVTIVFFLFVRRFCHVMLVSICIISSMVETVGLMALWDVRLDITATMALTLCLGFSINYPTHFSYAFITSKSHSSKERIRMALHQIGLPIIQGSVTTLCAVIVLAFQQVKLYNSVFKIVFLIVFQAAFHSLFVLPIALSFVSNIILKCAEKKPKPQNSIFNLEAEKEALAP